MDDNGSCPFLKMKSQGVDLDKYGTFGCPSCPARICWDDMIDNKAQYEEFRKAFGKRVNEVHLLYGALIHSKSIR